MQAIILSISRKNDKSILIHAFTREQGLQVYSLYGAGSRKKSLGALVPLSIVDLTEQYTKMPIKVIKEATMIYVPRRVPTDPKRQVLALFVAEALTKVLTYTMTDEPLYDYITIVAKEIDTTDEFSGFANQFLVRLSELLGYGGAAIDEIKNLRSAEMLRIVFDDQDFVI